MANEIATATTSGQTLYAVLRNSAAQVWSTPTQAFEAYNSAHWTSYALALSEQGASGYYVASFPVAIAAPGRYSIEIRVQSGASPALADSVLTGGSLVWNGSAEVVVQANASGQVQADLTQAVPTSNTAQTLGDALNAARAQAFGAWRIAGTSLTLYAPDGTTAVHSFTLDSATSPTSRT